MKTPQGREPDLQRQSPAVDFIENSLDKYHPAFSTPPSRYDPYLGGFVLRDSTDVSSTSLAHAMAVAVHDGGHSPVPESALAAATHLNIVPRPTPQKVDALEFWDTLFPQAMAQLLKAHPHEPENLLKSGYRIRDKKTWTEVFDQVEAAQNHGSKVDNKFKVGFRKVYRKFGEHAAEPLNRMTKLVPAGGDMGALAVTPIIGCVQILLEASRAASNVRKTVIGSFDEVDKMFSEVELFLQIYPGDENIERASIKLVADTLFAAEIVIAFFLKGTGTKFLAATVHRENYEKSTIESLNDIKLQCEQLLQEAEKSHKYQTFRANNHLIATTTSIQAEMQSMRHEQVRLHDVRNTIHELLDEFDRRNILLYQRIEEEFERRMAQRSFVAIDAEPYPSRPALVAWTHPASAPTPSVQHIVDPNDLVRYIGISDILSKDFQHLSEKRTVAVPAPEQARAEQLIRTSQIREWLTSPTSSQLLVHGNYDRRAYISGLSLFCMSLAQTLAERVPRFIPLVFFCGLHTEPLQEAHTGGRAIIQSFIRQLLCQYDFNGGNISMEPEALDDVQNGDVDALCSLFERLVHMLPNGVALFCLVDGVVYYERDEFVHGLEQVLMTILQLSDKEGMQAPVKVLLTSPTRTTRVRQPFPDDLILSMEGMVRADLVASSSRLGRELSSGIE